MALPPVLVVIVLFIMIGAGFHGAPLCVRNVGDTDHFPIASGEPASDKKDTEAPDAPPALIRM